MLHAATLSIPRRPCFDLAFLRAAARLAQAAAACVQRPLFNTTPMNPPNVSSSNRAHSTVATDEVSVDTAPNATSPARPEPTRPATSRRNDSFWANMKRKLAPRPVTISNSLLGSITRTRPTPARARVGVTPDQRHQPDPNATPPSAVAKHKH